MMIELIIALGVIIFLCLVLAGWVIGGYNTFVNARQDINNQWSNIKTEYQRRADLFYNLVSTVKGYASHEKETFKLITEARGGIKGNNTSQEMKKMGALDSIFAKGLVFENYPELKASKNFLNAQKEIRSTEDSINIARTDYNAIVRDYNVLVKQFPKSLLANMFGFLSELYFESESGTDKAPKLNFS